MCGAPRVLPVHRHTSEYQGQVQDHQQGLLLQVRSERLRALLAYINLPSPLLQVQRPHSETNAGTRPGELCQETVLSEVRSNVVQPDLDSNPPSVLAGMFAL